MNVSIRSPHGCKGRFARRARPDCPDRFQSAPLTDVRGDICRLRIVGDILNVSIRSPHGCKGRYAPRRGHTRQHVAFQSAPLTDVRGDPRSFWPRACNVPVSIRSPHGCKGRCSFLGFSKYSSWFQSAPLTDVRGDQLWGVSTLTPRVFQSAPLTDVRGDLRGFHALFLAIRFNPLPSRM